MRITPDSYERNPAHRLLADRIMTAGSLEPNRVHFIDCIDEASGFACTIDELDENGRPFIRDGELATTVVVVRP